MLAISSNYLNGQLQGLSKNLPSFNLPSLPNLPSVPTVALPESVRRVRSAVIERYERINIRTPTAVRSLLENSRSLLDTSTGRIHHSVRACTAYVFGSGEEHQLLLVLQAAEPILARPSCCARPAMYIAFDPLGRSSGACSSSYSKHPSAPRRAVPSSRRSRRAALGRVHATPSTAAAEIASTAAATALSAAATGAPGIASSVVAKACANFLGWGVLVGSCLRSVPQIMRIWKKQSVQGISLLSNLTEMAAYTVIVGYNLSHRYPFSTFGDTAMCLLQDVVLLGLFVKFGNLPAPAAAMGTALLGGLGCWVASGSCGPTVLNALQGSSMLLLSLGSRVPQIVMNWRRGNTGELSLTTSLLNFSGNIARLFTTCVLTQDALILAGTGLQTVMNGILVAQIWKSNHREGAVPGPKAPEKIPEKAAEKPVETKEHQGAVGLPA